MAGEKLKSLLPFTNRLLGGWVDVRALIAALESEYMEFRRKLVKGIDGGYGFVDAVKFGQEHAESFR